MERQKEGEEKDTDGLMNKGHTHMHTHTHILCIHACTHIMHPQLHAYMHPHMHAYMHTRMHICVCTYAYALMNTHPHTPTLTHPHPHPHPLTPTRTAHLLAEGPILHLKFLEVGGEGGLSPTPSRGEEADNNVHHVQRLAKEVWGPELQENISLYLRGEGDLEEEEEVEEGKEEGRW